ncbi:MAG TPA: hypothetical protein VI953_04160 [Candidatus Paceibacterota bacterium]
MSDLIKNGGTLWELAKALVEQIHNQGGSDATARALISNDELMVRIAQLSVGPVWETERLAGFANPSTLEVNTAMSLLDLQTWVGGKVSVHPNQPEFSESRIERKYGLAIAHVPWSFTYDQELDAGGNGPGGWEHADYRDLLCFVEHFGAGALKPARLVAFASRAKGTGTGEPTFPCFDSATSQSYPNGQVAWIQKACRTHKETFGPEFFFLIRVHLPEPAKPSRRALMVTPDGGVVRFAIPLLNTRGFEVDAAYGIADLEIAMQSLETYDIIFWGRQFGGRTTDRLIEQTAKDPRFTGTQVAMSIMDSQHQIKLGCSFEIDPWLTGKDLDRLLEQIASKQKS